MAIDVLDGRNGPPGGPGKPLELVAGRVAILNLLGFSARESDQRKPREDTARPESLQSIYRRI